MQSMQPTSKTDIATAQALQAGAGAPTMLLVAAAIQKGASTVQAAASDRATGGDEGKKAESCWLGRAVKRVEKFLADHPKIAIALKILATVLALAAVILGTAALMGAPALAALGLGFLGFTAAIPQAAAITMVAAGGAYLLGRYVALPICRAIHNRAEKKKEADQAKQAKLEFDAGDVFTGGSIDGRISKEERDQAVQQLVALTNRIEFLSDDKNGSDTRYARGWGQDRSNLGKYQQERRNLLHDTRINWQEVYAEFAVSKAQGAQATFEVLRGLGLGPARD